MPDVLSTVRTRYHLLSPVQRRIADRILEDPAVTVRESIGDLASRCDTSETTVMRLLRKLGFGSFQIFKVTLAGDLGGEPHHAVYEDVRDDDDVRTITRKIVTTTNESISDLESNLDPRMVELIVDLITKSRRVLFVGIGATGLIASDACYEFAKLGLNVSVSSDPSIMRIQATHLSDTDLLFAISHSGETADIVECVELAKAVGARVASVTSYRNSRLSQASDAVLLSSTNNTVYRPDAMLSRVGQLVIIDILYVATILRLQPESLERLKRSATVLGRGRRR